jgi:midasin (ATPase involved in ribosome maturation)
MLHRLIYELFEISVMPTLDMTTKLYSPEKFVILEDFIIPKGGHKSDFSIKDFILTPTFKQLVKRLASIVAVSDYAVILEGPTSAGKTSTV